MRLFRINIVPYGGGDTDAEPPNLSGRQPYMYTASPGFRRRIICRRQTKIGGGDRKRNKNIQKERGAKCASHVFTLRHTAEEIRMQNRRTYPGASRICIRQVPDFGGRDASVPVCAVYPRRIICRRPSWRDSTSPSRPSRGT